MKIEDHSTAEISWEDSKRSRVCFSCGLKKWEEINDNSYRKNKIELSLLEPPWKRLESGKEIPIMEYLCKNCSNKINQQWLIESLEKTIKFREDKIKKIKKPNCDKCQINAMHNPSHKTCGVCGAKAYDDCVCDLYYIENDKRALDNLLAGVTGPLGHSRVGGITCISYARNLIFTCPVHGRQIEDHGKNHSRNKFYRAESEKNL